MRHEFSQRRLSIELLRLSGADDVVAHLRDEEVYRNSHKRAALASISFRQASVASQRFGIPATP
jgi:hypothetical protein